jgi:hypothetical protein
MKWMTALASFGLLSLACADNDHRATPDAGPVEPDAVPGCNPVGADCLTPFPSSFQETADTTTATGVRVNLAANAIPHARNGLKLDLTRWNARDGFSPAMPFLVYFPSGIDMTNVPAESNDGMGSSILTSSAVQIIDYATGERVPLFAELDLNVVQGDRQALIIRPMVRLKPATRYLVALVGLKDKSGNAIEMDAFDRIRDGKTPSALYDDIFAKLEADQVPRASLTLAWDVTTESEQPIARMQKMVSDSIASVDAGDVTWTVDSSVDAPAGAVARTREVLLTVNGPSYLAADLKTDPEALLNLVGGVPTVRAMSGFPVTIEIPQCVADGTATGPIPYIVFGHGLFGNAHDTLQDTNLLTVANNFCMVLVGTDWLGLTDTDLPNLTDVIGDFNKFVFVTDHLQQAHVNAQVMAHLLAGALSDQEAALQYGGYPIIDKTHGYYFGVSDGGIQGGTFMSLSKDVTRGILNVPGGEWNLMMFRSSHFGDLNNALMGVFQDAMDRQTLVALTQMEWDYTDPIEYAPHLVTDYGKHIILQESENDEQVPNVATRLLARTMGLQSLPLVNMVYGITQTPGPLDSAYTQWDSHPTTFPPMGDVPPTDDNHAHDGIQSSPMLRSQAQMFFTDTGQAVDTCGGPCSL